MTPGWTHACVCALAVGAAPRIASASGFDIPTLYTAEHAGMGGAAVGSVDDASAVYHNPAGLAGLHGLGVTAGLSLFVAQAQTSPDAPDQNLSTGNRVGPAFIAAAGYRAHEWVSVGLGVYPVAAGGGKLRYTNAAGVATVNEQQLLAIEVSPALSVNFPRGVSIGAGYRITALRYQAERGPAANPILLDMDLRGANFAGFRAGAMWRIGPHWSIGAAYRHRLRIRAKGDQGAAAGERLTGVSGEVVYPAKVAAGVRMDYGPIGVALDVDYVFNRQYRTVKLAGDLPEQDSHLEVALVSRWHDAVIVHGGVEGRIRGFAIRGGYAFDQSAANRAFPSTFGTPPSHGHFGAVGFGYATPRWQVNLAVAHRFSTEVVLAEDEIDTAACGIFCARAGHYRSRLTGVFVDFGYLFAI